MKFALDSYTFLHFSHCISPETISRSIHSVSSEGLYFQSQKDTYLLTGSFMISLSEKWISFFIKFLPSKKVKMYLIIEERVVWRKHRKNIMTACIFICLMQQPSSPEKNINSSRNVSGSIQANLDFILDITDVKCMPIR